MVMVVLSVHLGWIVANGEIQLLYSMAWEGIFSGKQQRCGSQGIPSAGNSSQKGLRDERIEPMQHLPSWSLSSYKIVTYLTYSHLPAGATEAQGSEEAGP